MEIYKEFSFDAAHYLPKVPEGHKCRNMHGHTYSVKVVIEGAINKDGWVQDFGDIKKIVKPIISKLDHSLLNEIEGLENPTAEILAVWIWEKLIEGLPGLARIEVKETPTSGVIYRGK